MIRMRTRIFTFTFLARPFARLAGKEESVDQLDRPGRSAQVNDRPALYLKIARLKEEEADKDYDNGNAEAGKAAPQDGVT